MKMFSGLIIGMILTSSMADAGPDPCDKVYRPLKNQGQIENLRCQQRLLIERFAEDKR